MLLKQLALSFSIFCIMVLTFGQQAGTTTNSITQDPQAVAFAAQARIALAGGLALQDVTLSGTETRIAGSSSATEPVTLKALGTDNARIDRSQSNTSEIRSSPSNSPAGVWTDPASLAHQMSIDNCWTDATWFFPAFWSVFANSPGVQLTYVGLETIDGVSVQHIRSSKFITDPSGNTSAQTISFIAKLSQMDIYLDSQSFLPVAIRFNQHPDNDAGVDVPVQIVFSDYRIVNGDHVPFRIEKYIQNGLNIDLVITTATLNSGLTVASFQVQ